MKKQKFTSRPGKGKNPAKPNGGWSKLDCPDAQKERDNLEEARHREGSKSLRRWPKRESCLPTSGQGNTQPSRNMAGLRFGEYARR